MACHTGRFGFLSRAVLGLALMAVGGAVAAEQVEVLRVQQRYPWNGLVDVDYAISGIDGDPCDYRIALSFTIETNGVPFTVVASNFNDVAACDLPTANGTWRVTWDTAADGVEVVSKKVKARIGLVYEPVSESEAAYAIIDISGGLTAETYPLRYVKDASIDVRTFNREPYKSTKIVLKRVAGDEFWMGEGDVRSGTSRHRVRLTHDYFLSPFLITQRQYELVVGTNPSWFNEDEVDNPASARPVEYIAWNTITKSGGFMALLTSKIRVRGSAVGTFGLPTEAQWEFAARAGSSFKYPWGSNVTTPIGEYAWWKGDGVTVTQAVGGKQPNGWGFYDMLGNVWEWCNDIQGNYPAYSETEVTEDPTGALEGNNRVARGGSISGDEKYYCVPGARGGYHYSLRVNQELGFRLARTIP